MPPTLWNGFGTKVFTIECRHFSIHYTDGLEQVAREAGAIFENLYDVYSKTYGIVLPAKTKVLIIDGEITNGLADPNHNFIILWPHDFDINLRGTHDWLKGVIAHEYGHILSITAGLKLPPFIPAIQIGYYNHPNEPYRIEALHIFPGEILPPWFTEGIAQYEDSRKGTDSWDSHRDMILRTLVVSGTMLPQARMFEFAGNGEDLEKTYNHGFSLVKYIADTYGYDKVVSLLKECTHFFRLDFNAAVKKVLGITGRQLYDDWKRSLEIKYSDQVKKLGKQVYGRKINKEGYDNYWPKFSPDGKKIFFISNGKADFSFFSKSLYSYSLVDTVKDDKKIKEEKGVSGFYSIHAPSGLIAFTSMKSGKSTLPANKGGCRVFDAFIDTLPPEKKVFNPFKRKTERQVTKRQSVFGAVFSPTGEKLALVLRSIDKFYLCIADTNGKKIQILYPDTAAASSIQPFKYIYSFDWSADGRHIAISYIDTGFRRIGVYDTLTHQLDIMKNAGYDDRDPRYSADGKNLYFSSDRTGIFNIYRYTFETHALERLTNVSGGAFSPDVSKDQKKLVCANYDKGGYGIYLIDSMIAVAQSQEDSLFAPRQSAPVPPAPSAAGETHPYSYFPTMFMLAPTFIVEQAIPQIYDVFKGRSVVKAGAVGFLEDPLASVGMGTQIGAYLLLEPDKVNQFINLDKSFFGRKINFDLGVFGNTKTLPVDLSFEYQQRAITESDYFYWDASGTATQQPLDYQITLRYLDLMVSHPLAEGLNSHLIGSYNWYEVYMLLEDAFRNIFPGTKDFVYNVAQGYRAGAYLSLLAPEYDQRMFISPRGIAAKLQYNYWSQYLLNEKGVTFENGLPRENYDMFKYHELGGTLKFGMTSPWYEYHDLYAEVNATAIVPHEKITNSLLGTHTKEKDLPSYYKPVEWLKGYAYFFKGTLKKADASADSIIFDTVLVTGNAVASINLSYRFPLWPGLQIGKRLWFFNIDQIYGAVNFCAGAGWQNPSDILPFRKENWLSSAGGEIRLKAKSFGFPMAISLRYDNGFNKPWPLGGDHVTFSLGFGFDNWDLIDLPDYYASLATK